MLLCDNDTNIFCYYIMIYMSSLCSGDIVVLQILIVLLLGCHTVHVYIGATRSAPGATQDIVKIFASFNNW